MLRCKVDKLGLIKVWVRLDLQHSRLDASYCKDLGDLISKQLVSGMSSINGGACMKEQLD
jgi:hypothetical protein